MQLLPLSSDMFIYTPPLTRFSKDMKWMAGRKLNLYWQITWKFISPLLLLIVFVAFVTLQIQKMPTYAAWNPKYVCSLIFAILNRSEGCMFFSPTRSFKTIAVHTVQSEVMKCSDQEGSSVHRHYKVTHTKMAFLLSGASF